MSGNPLLLTLLLCVIPLGTTELRPRTKQSTVFIQRVASSSQKRECEQISCDGWNRERALTHLYHVDNMVRQPESAEHHHDGQDEFLAADLSLELGLLQASQDEEVAGYDDCVGKNESHHCLEGVVKTHLHTGG